MPIYEYQCHECQRRVSLLWRSYADMDTKQATCPRCGGQNLSRLISRVAVVRSEEGLLEDLADPSALAGLDENDPKSLARWMRKMGQEMGEDLGEEFGEVIDRLESGQSPEEIEESMPDLGPAMGGPGMGGDDFGVM